MPVLLGMEVVALSAVAYKLPAVRATARELASSVYDTVVGTDDTRIAVAPSDGKPASTSKQRVTMIPRAIILPELRGEAEAGKRSSHAHTTHARMWRPRQATLPLTSH